ncbi:MAG: hypothetical protein U5M23_07090 [Marinagarivorans sp.]|nr:hypothetical protein [Marinagarivorans sp.]
MTAPKNIKSPPAHLLACPNCQAPVHEQQGFIPAQNHCSACQQTFFDLSGMPCWFDVGLAQQQLWQTLYAKAIALGESNLEKSQSLDTRAMLASSQRRYQLIEQTNQSIVKAIDTLLGEAGLSKKIDPDFAKHDASRMLQYFELLLRDWAWDSEITAENNENARELERIAKAINASRPHLGEAWQLGDIWVIGAGAGRLSWDMHAQLRTQGDQGSTIALDTNPVLITLAHRLLSQQKPWQLAELHPNPQRQLPLAKVWDIQPPKVEGERAKNWYAVAANAWRPPLQAGSFDTLVTPWFMDVNGREVKDLIAQVQKYLKPGGLWLNTGPLLYSPDIPDHLRYSHDEIIELIELAGFTVLYQNSVKSLYLNTPLSDEERIDQVWTFAAIAPTANTVQPTTAEGTAPAWIILPHLPIPTDLKLNTHGNPILEHLAAQVNGHNSLNTIAEQMRKNLGEGKDPVAVVRNAFLEYLLGE